MKRIFIILAGILKCINTTSIAGLRQRIVVDQYGNGFFQEAGANGIISVSKCECLKKPLQLKNRLRRDLMLDPSGDKKAIKQFSKPEDKYGESVYYLTVLNSKTRDIIIRFEGVGNLFAFSPNGDAIVYSADYPGKEEWVKPPPNFQPGLWLYNFRLKIRTQIFGDSPWDVNWSSHDGNIYFVQGKYVYCYDPGKAQSVKTELTRNIFYQ